MSVSELFSAIKEGDRERVEALLADEPALANAHDEAGMSAVLAAAYWSQPAIVAALLAHGPQLDLFEAAAANDLARVAEITAGHPELAAAHARDGFTALGLASFFGHAEIAAHLLALGADPNQAASNAMRVAPLHSAAAGRHLEIARMLIAAGADVNAAQEGGFTPIHAAAQNGHAELVELLLAHGADPSAATADGKTARQLALAAGHADLADRL